MSDVTGKEGDVPLEVKPETSESIRFTETIEEAKGKLDADAKAVTADSLNVDQASFDKFFKDGVMDWASYGKEQAFKAAQKTEEKATEDKPETPAEEAEAADTEALQGVVEGAGLDWNELGQQLVDTGDISEESKEALKKIGIPEEVVDNYIELIKADADSQIDTVVEAFGGEDKFTAVYDKLVADVDNEQRMAIDAMLKNPATFDMGVKMAYELSGVPEPEGGLKPLIDNTQKASEENTEIVTPNASAGGTNEAKGFTSFAEQVAAQRSDRYKTDPQFRAQVMERIKASQYDLNPRMHSGGL